MRQVGQQPAGISSIGIVALVEEGTNFRNQSGERAFLDDLDETSVLLPLNTSAAGPVDRYDGGRLAPGWLMAGGDDSLDSLFRL